MASLPDPSAPAGARSAGDLAGWLWSKLGDALDGPFRALQRHIGANRMAYVFLVPNVLVFGLFSFWPMMLNFYIAFTGGQSAILAERPFVGLENFRELLDCGSWLDPKSCPVAGFSFWTGIWNTLFFALVQVPVMIVVALATALVLNRDIAGRGFWRAVFFYPVMLSPVVVAVIWDWVLKRRGILNALIDDAVTGWNAFVTSGWFPFVGGFVLAAFLHLIMARLFRLMKVPRSEIWGAGVGIGLALLLVFSTAFREFLTLPDYRPVNWLIDVRSGWPMFWVIFVYTWGHLGFYMLILLAGLQAIPKDLYEAAEMDGTSKARQFWRITLPLLMPTMVVVLVLSLIRAFQAFDEIYVLTGGGPGQATKLIIQHVYEMAFIGDAKRYGIASASSVLVAAVLLVLTLGQLAATRRRAGG
ncbi:carbohydrate ABC transporter permease [Rhabdaerophilum calidifontis]|uniref:carbohydrate ABC transporter permease n=1 Tax=Rhabdaerophilum calidifontis TaxID=2604328 RepID=UPI00123B4797|nr:sugar ABC transporter permease [Rhabdaerophilum calidifontis]